MKNFFKSKTSKLLALFIALILITTQFSFMSAYVARNSAYAAETDAPTDFINEEVSITNGQFSDIGSGYPGTISSWTGEYIIGSEGAATGGINLSDPNIKTSNIEDDLKLTSLPESPFGKNTDDPGKDLYFKGTNRNVMMINSGGTEIAYGYTSASISLAKNSYYKISAWAKTSEDAAAHIKIGTGTATNTGFKNQIGFERINTTNIVPAADAKESNNFGWIEYTLFIETSTLYDSNVAVTLALGNKTEYLDADGNKQTTAQYASTGYAFFANVTAWNYSSEAFKHEVANFYNETDLTLGNTTKKAITSDENRFIYMNSNENTLFYSENDSAPLSIKDKQILSPTDAEYLNNEIGSFNRMTENMWSAANNTQGSSWIFEQFNSTNEGFGIKENADIPYSPNGKDNSIALMSTYNAAIDNYDSRNFGIATPKFTINRHEFYKVSVWVKTINGNTASVVIAGDDYRGANRLYVSSGLIGSSDGAVASRNNWKQQSFFIKGSAFANYDVHIELWLGRGQSIDNNGNPQSAENVAGVAMFDNLTIEKINGVEYSTYSGAATTVTFDVTSSSGGISNSSFNEVQDFSALKYPLSPSSWTFAEVSDNNAVGMSKKTVVGNDNDIIDQSHWNKSVVRGVIPTDQTSFDAHKGSFGSLPANPGTVETEISNIPGSNALLISSNEKVAVGYMSSNFSVESSSTNRIDIDMRLYDISGYGANLVLRKNDRIISTIENIGGENGVIVNSDWHTYSFYIQTGSSSPSDLVIEVWLGLYDKVNNTSKLASGSVVVDRVSVNSVSADSYNAKAAAIKNTADIYNDYNVISLGTDDFDGFDRYSTDFIKDSYKYTLSEAIGNVELGVFDSENITQNTSYLWDGYSNDNSASQYKLLVRNNGTGYSRVKAISDISISAGSYYKLTFGIKVKIGVAQASERPSFMGAYVGINAGNETHFITNITSTTQIVNVLDPSSDNVEYFREYTLYIQGADGEDTANNVSIEFGIGGSSVTNQASGCMIVSHIVLETLPSDAEYIKIKESIKNNDSAAARTSLAISFASGTVGDDIIIDDDKDLEKGGSTTFEGNGWLVVSGILLAVVIVFVLLAVLVRYLARKRKAGKAKDAGKRGTYDRKTTLAIQHNRRAMGDTGSITSIDVYDIFDEELEDEFDEHKKAVAGNTAKDKSLLEAEATEIKDDIVDTNAANIDSNADQTTEIEANTESDEAFETESTDADADAKSTDAETNTESTDSNERIAETSSPAEADEATDVRVDYDEVIDFSNRKFDKPVIIETQTETEAIEKKKEEIDDETIPTRTTTWDNFED